MINVLNAPKAYSEVYEFINVLGDEYKNKIPSEIYLNIENNRDRQYVPKYNAKQEINSSTFSKEALALISILNLQYWCDDPKEVSRLKSVYMKNEEIEKERISPKNIFKNNFETTTPSLSLVEYKKENWLEKLFNKIKNFFVK